ncbi:MAG: opacity family porin [Alysiella sp.]|uniref:opacity family porin n=1 Tax=Alysiella sp. TaxID=1872483 RepID=UPI0026DB89D0|nr:opacity family porin [Alysiella sp.]MDO4434494.1 opacity family porin [Alysiella sp.]
MTKIIRLTTLIATLAGSSFAVAETTYNNAGYNNAETGFYVQGDVGLAHVRANSKFESIKKSYKDSKFLPRISAGYDFGNFRVAGDYTRYGKVDERTNNASAQTKAHSLGVSAIYDFPTGDLQPYVGARLATNHIKRVETTTTRTVKESETKLGVGVLAGVGYKIDNNMTLDAGYRYNHLDSNLKSHEATVGLRYKF